MHLFRLMLVSAGLLAIVGCSSKKSSDPGVAPPPVGGSTWPERTVIDSGPGDTADDAIGNSRVPGMGSGGEVIRDAAPVVIADADAPDVPSAANTCDLLLQDCPAKGYGKQSGCYPVANAIGRCWSPAGTLGVMSQCFPGENNDSPLCAPGLACLTTAKVANVCLRLCDLTGSSTNPETLCAANEPCLPLYGSARVGYCSP